MNSQQRWLGLTLIFVFSPDFESSFFTGTQFWSDGGWAQKSVRPCGASNSQALFAKTWFWKFLGARSLWVLLQMFHWRCFVCFNCHGFKSDVACEFSFCLTAEGPIHTGHEHATCSVNTSKQVPFACCLHLCVPCVLSRNVRIGRRSCVSVKCWRAASAQPDRNSCAKSLLLQ